MSEPSRETRAAFAEARAAFEPGAERLERLRAGIVASAEAPAAGARGPLRSWRGWGSALGVALVALVGLHTLRGDPPPRKTVEPPAAPPVLAKPALVAAEPVLLDPPPPMPAVEAPRAAPLGVQRPRAAPRAVPRAPNTAAAPHEDVFGPAFDVPEQAPSPSDWIVAHEDGQDAPAQRVARARAAEAQHTEQARATREGGMTSADTLRAEAALLQRARSALSRDDLSGARLALSEHTQRHPAGQLLPERRALEVQTACVAGDLRAARSAFAQLLMLRPSAALRTGVERRCGALLKAP